MLVVLSMCGEGNVVCVIYVLFVGDLKLFCSMRLVRVVGTSAANNFPSSFCGLMLLSVNRLPFHASLALSDHLLQADQLAGVLPGSGCGAVRNARPAARLSPWLLGRMAACMAACMAVCLAVCMAACMAACMALFWPPVKAL